MTFIDIMNGLVAGESPATQKAWADFHSWAENTAWPPRDEKSARRTDRWQKDTAMVDTMAKALKILSPSEYGRRFDAKGHRMFYYALWMIVAAKRADDVVCAFADRAASTEERSRHESWSDWRQEILVINLYARWAGHDATSPLRRHLEKIFKDPDFQQDPCLSFARRIGLNPPEDDFWRATVLLREKEGEAFRFGLSATLNYPSHSSGKVLLQGNLGYEKSARELWDFSAEWAVRGDASEAPEVSMREGHPDLEKRYPPEAFPQLRSMDEFPLFLDRLEAMFSTRFNRRKPTALSGFKPSERAIVIRWLEGALPTPS